jgi:hypothetical protein
VAVREGSKDQIPDQGRRAASSGGEREASPQGASSEKRVLFHFGAEGPEGANEPCNLPDIDAETQQITMAFSLSADLQRSWLAQRSVPDTS